jgi:ABC-type Co2+ transport system permease subunit
MKPFQFDLSNAGMAWPFFALALSMCAQVAVAAVNLPPNAPAPMRFAADEITRAASAKRLAIDVSLAIQSSGVSQSYRIERDGAKLHVIGADPAGAMYGGLDVAEAIRTGALAQLKAGEHRPYIAQHQE